MLVWMQDSETEENLYCQWLYCMLSQCFGRVSPGVERPSESLAVLGNLLMEECKECQAARSVSGHQFELKLTISTYGIKWIVRTRYSPQCDPFSSAFCLVGFLGLSSNLPLWPSFSQVHIIWSINGQKPFTNVSKGQRKMFLFNDVFKFCSYLLQ